MTENSSTRPRLALTDADELGQIVVDLESFFEFSFWMAEELEDLVACWSHLNPSRGHLHRESMLNSLD